MSVTSKAVSPTLVREENGAQRPVYYTSHTLRGAENRYPLMELIGFTLVVAALCLRPYFQAYSIKVLIEAPLKKAMQ